MFKAGEFRARNEKKTSKKQLFPVIKKPGGLLNLPVFIERASGLALRKNQNLQIAALITFAVEGQ